MPAPEGSEYPAGRAGNSSEVRSAERDVAADAPWLGGDGELRNQAQGTGQRVGAGAGDGVC